jgi:amidase
MIPRPSTDELRDYAAAVGFSPPDSELEDYSALVDGLLASIEDVESIEEPSFEMHDTAYPREGGARPAEADNPYNAWITRCRVEGAKQGPLAGKTVGLKDNIALADVEMTCASKLFEGYVPRIDATVVRRLLDAGATIVGKLNMEALALSGSGDVSDFGSVLNPLNTDYLAGGSSSGSGAAPAAGDCDIAIGADQGGSIRMPSAWCGLVGIKPTSGLVPYTGIMPIDMSIDHVGPLGRTVEDVAITLTAIAGEDVQMGTALDPRQPAGVKGEDYVDALDADIGDIRIGLLREGVGWESSDAVVDAAISAAMDSFRELGAEVGEVSVPLHRRSRSLWTAVGVPGGIYFLRENAVGSNFDGWYNTDLLDFFQEHRASRAERYPPTLKPAWLAIAHLDRHGARLPYARAQNIALGLRRAYDEQLQRVDVLAMPTTPMLPFPHDPELSMRERVGRTLDNLLNTAPFDLTAHPALSVPCGITEDDLPIGLMLVGRHLEEGTLLRVAAALEAKIDWRDRTFSEG